MISTWLTHEGRTFKSKLTEFNETCSLIQDSLEGLELTDIKEFIESTSVPYIKKIGLLVYSKKLSQIDIAEPKLEALAFLIKTTLTLDQNSILDDLIFQFSTNSRVIFFCEQEIGRAHV